MHRNRSLPLAAALLSIISLGVAATALESAPISSSYEVPAGSDGGSDLSIMGVLRLLLIALLGLFGVEIGPPAATHGFAIDALVSVLSFLVSVAPFVLAGGVFAVIVLLAARRLPESDPGPLAAMLPGRRRRTETASGSDSTIEDWPPADPGDDVSGAWVAMTESLDIERPRSRTPAEWADAAVRSGFDDDAVTELTRAFTAVRYGDASETPERRRRVKRELGRIEGDAER